MSEVKFSKLKIENGEWRIDSEYFKKEYLNEDSDLAKHKTVLLGNYAFVTDGQHGYYETDPSSKIHMLAARNCKDYFANTTDSIPLAKWVDDKNKRSSLAHGDIILSTRGSVGCCAIVYDEVLPANINQDVARIKLNNSDDFRPEFLIAYMNCKFGQNWMFRNQTGMVQQGLPLDKVRSIPVPMLSPAFQSQIEQIVKSAHAKLAESKSLYAQAEEILLSELGLKDWQPKKESVSVKSFSDFAKSGRLDSEYYQPKYDELFNHLLHYNCVKLGDIVSIKKSVEPGSESYIAEGIPFIRVSDVSKFEISKTDLHLSPKEFDLKALRPHKDTILFSKDGSIGIAYKCQKDLNVITSGALLHLDVRDETILPDYLTIVLNSMVTKLQAERDSNGAIIQHWKPEDIKKVVIPVLSMQNQSLIAEKIQKSFDLRKQSKELLESAKLMVEEEIEK